MFFTLLLLFAELQLFFVVVGGDVCLWWWCGVVVEIIVVMCGFILSAFSNYVYRERGRGSSSYTSFWSYLMEVYLLVNTVPLSLPLI